MKAELLADKEWRKISDAYKHHTKEDYLVLYEMFIDAFTKGFKQGEWGGQKSAQTQRRGY